MIRLPQRSVTRFFIPLIDVLTLLFCIFLLMPMVRPAPESDDAPDAGPVKEVEVPEPPPAETERQRRELDRLRREKIETLQKRLVLRVLEIDADNGNLYYQEGEQRVQIRNQADAAALIARHREEAADRELYYLFLYPRRLTGYPEQGQIRAYERWFEGVAHGTDNPRGRR